MTTSKEKLYFQVFLSPIALNFAFIFCCHGFRPMQRKRLNIRASLNNILYCA